jgi:hypothetical protein
MFSCVVWVPVDVVKERLQAQLVLSENSSQRLYNNSWHAFWTIVKTEGWRNGLYKGYGITLFSFGPFSALYFLFYEKVRYFLFVCFVIFSLSCRFVAGQISLEKYAF